MFLNFFSCFPTVSLLSILMNAPCQACRGKAETNAFLTAASVISRPHSTASVSPSRPHRVHIRVGKRRNVFTHICSVVDGGENLSIDDNNILRDLRNDGKPPQVLALIKLTKMAPRHALHLIQVSGVYESKYRKTRIAVLDALGKFRIRTEIPTLVSVLCDDSDHSIRAAAAGALGVLLSPLDNGNDVDSDINDDPNREVSQSEPSTDVAQLQDDVHDRALLALRNAALNDDHFIVRYSAIVALGNGRDTASISLLLPIIANQDAAALEVASAIDALGEIIAATDVPQKCLEHVIARTTDSEDLIRAAVARTLGQWRSIRIAADTLHKMLSHEIRLERSSFVLDLLQRILNSNGNA